MKPTLKKNPKMRWYSIDQVFKKAGTKPAFREAYRAETARIKLARTVRDLRTAQKLTQTTVAERASMPQSVLARLESGDHGVSVDTLSRVAHALGKHVELV